MRVVRSLCEKNAKKCSEEISSNNNEQLLCKGKEIMTEVYNDCKEGDLKNSPLKTGDSTERGQLLEETGLRTKQPNSGKAQLALEYLLAK